LGDVTTAAQLFSFNRLCRLLKPAEFQQVFSKAKRSGDRYFTVLWQPNELQTARLGFAIAKKKIALATARNRIRRLARESFRYHRAQLICVDIIIMAQPAAKQASNDELRSSLEKHWLKISREK
jgi:ribonuclease P protein component